MPVVSVDAYSVRVLAAQWQRLERVTIELREEIQYRILGMPEYQPYLGSMAYELQEMLRRLNEEQMIIASQIRELFGWAQDVEGISGSFGVPGSFLQPSSTFTWRYPTQTLASSSYVSRFSSWFGDPVSIRWLGAYIYGGRSLPLPSPFDWNLRGPSWVNRLAAQGINVNVV